MQPSKQASKHADQVCPLLLHQRAEGEFDQQAGGTILASQPIIAIFQVKRIEGNDKITKNKQERKLDFLE